MIDNQGRSTMAHTDDHPTAPVSITDVAKDGVMPGGGVVPFRLPAGALNYLDRNQYISNMEVIAYYPKIDIAIFGDEHSCLWAKGKRRLIAFKGGWIDITEPKKATVIAHNSFGVFSSCVYNSGLKKWIGVVAHQMPLTPGTPQYPRGKYHPDYARKAIEDAGFRGIKTCDVTNPDKVELLDEFETGRTGHGVHLPFYDGGKYAYLACGWDDQLRMESTERVYSNGLMIVDMTDPAKVQEVSRWWVPGQRLDEEELYRTTYPFAGDQCSWTSNRTPCVVPVRVEDGGTVGYGGWGEGRATGSATRLPAVSPSACGTHRPKHWRHREPYRHPRGRRRKRRDCLRHRTGQRGHRPAYGTSLQPAL